MLEEGKYYWVRMTADSPFEICRYNDKLFYNTRGQEMYASQCADYLTTALTVADSL